MKIAEIIELEDVRDALEAMSVAEVVIQSVVDDTKDPSTAWQSVVILATPDARFFTPWVLAVRPSESDARGAVVALLRGRVDARRAAQHRAPAVDGWNAVLTTQRAMRAVDVWRRHRGEVAAPAAAAAQADAPVPPPVPSYDEVQYERWRSDVRATRERRQMTQAQLAAQVGTTPTNLSRYERGVKKPALALAHAISDALGLQPPPVAEPPSVLRHAGNNGSNGAVAATRE